VEINDRDIKWIIQSNPGDIALYQIDNGMKTIYFSGEIPAISGFSEEEYQNLIRDDASKAVITEDRPLVYAAIQQCIAGQDVECTYRILNKNKGFIWIHAKARMLGTRQNHPLIIVNFMNTPQEMRMLDSFLNNDKRKIYICDAQTLEVYYANNTVMAEHPHQNYIGQPCYQFIRHLDHQCETCILKEMEGDNLYKEEWLDAMQNRYYRVDCKKISWYGRAALLMRLEDISSEKNLYVYLKEEQSTLKQIIDTIPAGICLFRKANGIITRIVANPYMCNIKNVSANEITGETFDYLFKRVHPDDCDKMKNKILRLFSDQSYVRDTYRTLNESTGRYMWLHMEGRTVKQEDGSQIAYIAYTDVTRLKETEQALQNTQQLYEIAIGAAKLVVLEYDIPSLRMKALNNGFDKYKYSRTKIGYVFENVPYSIAQMMDEENAQKYITMYENIRAGAPSASCQIWYKIMPSEEARCQQIIYTTIFDEQGKPIRAYGIGQDITPQKLAEKNYLRSLEDFAKIAPQLIAVFHLNLTHNSCRCTYQDDHYETHWNTTKTLDFFFDGITSFISNKQDRQIHAMKFNRFNLISCFRNGQFRITGEFQYDIKNKAHWFATYANLMQNPTTGDIEAVVSAFDTTDKRKNEQIMQRVVSESFDYIAIIDVADRTIQFYEMNQENYGTVPRKYSKYDEDIAYAFPLILKPEEVETYLQEIRLDSILRHLEKKSTFSIAFSMHDVHGKNNYRKQLNYCYLDHSRREILLTRIDVTSIYQVEQEHLTKIQEALESARQANTAKSDFLSNVSHDIRTPLNGILGFTDLAMNQDVNKKTYDYLKKIKTSGAMLLNLINDTLEISKIESGKTILNLEIIAIHDLIQSIEIPIKAAADEKDIEFIVSIDTLPFEYIQADQLNTQKILLNLLSNAIKFTPQGGMVLLSIEYLQPPFDGCNLKISICDTGIGISDDFLPKIFEPFAQENAPESHNAVGTGLGLSIVKSLIELMKGKIEVTSEKGGGTGFTLFLPFEPVYNPPKKHTHEVEAAQLAGIKILLCEDNILNREIATTLLEIKGVYVTSVSNGKEGVQRFACSNPFEFQAILMDIRMPVMDGLTAAREIRKLNRPDATSIPIIAMTANAFAEDIQQSKDAGMNDHLAKPINPEELFYTLATHISKK